MSYRNESFLEMPNRSVVKQENHSAEKVIWSSFFILFIIRYICLQSFFQKMVFSNNFSIKVKYYEQ